MFSSRRHSGRTAMSSAVLEKDSVCVFEEKPGGRTLLNARAIPPTSKEGSISLALPVTSMRDWRQIDDVAQGLC